MSRFDCRSVFASWKPPLNILSRATVAVLIVLLQFTDPTTGAESLVMRFNLTATEDVRIGGFGEIVLRIRSSQMLNPDERSKLYHFTE
jgi:hypothetical protein